MKYSIPTLPLSVELETKSILKKLAKAHQALAELKGVTGIIPNQSILINKISSFLYMTYFSYIRKGPFLYMLM